MNFNSYVFIIFILVVYTAYLLLRSNFRSQNLLLLIASYIFYGWWDWRFTSLLLLSTLVDFYIGKRLGRSEDPRERKTLVFCSIFTSLAILGFFKYFNFFAENFVSLLEGLGMKADPVSLKIILPIGISFYTFQTMSYVIDVYRKKYRPTENIIDFALFVSFFPQLVAGPIERANHLLTQIDKPRKIKVDQINAAVFLILWGYFKKVVVADHMAVIANQIFNNYTDFHGVDIIIGVLAFTFQIYGDFSGYSDIARGVAKLFGFELMVNFKLPYFAVSPSDFWKRWHISLSSWLQEYLYIPLGGNRDGRIHTVKNLMLTMLLGGLWHGASWNFVIWGGFHGVILVIYRFFGSLKKAGENIQAGGYIPRMALMFILTMIGWLLFRARSLDQISYMLTHISLSFSNNSPKLILLLIFFIVPLFFMELLQHRTGNLLFALNLKPYLCVPIYSFLLIWIITFGVRESMEFIYFQF